MKKIMILMLMIVLAGCASSKTIIKDNINVASDSAIQKTSESVDKYYVIKGDNLWDISGGSDVYNDSFKWVLIYKANRDQISDPNVIEVGQSLDINYNCSKEEVAQAIEKAKDTPPYKKKR